MRPSEAGSGAATYSFNVVTPPLTLGWFTGVLKNVQVAPLMLRLEGTKLMAMVLPLLLMVPLMALDVLPVPAGWLWLMVSVKVSLKEATAPPVTTMLPTWV